MKRFTETQKWEDPWFRKLKPEMKLLWQWLLDRCDNAGVIDPDLDLASFQIGYQYPIDTLSTFGVRLHLLSGGKYFIPKFIQFQYGQLSVDCKAHKPIFMSLQKHSIGGDLIGYPKGINTLQEKEKETDQEKETEKEKDACVIPSPKFAEVESFAKSQPFPISDECIDAFWDEMEALQWTYKGFPCVAKSAWHARFRKWSTNWANNAAGRGAK